MWLRPILSISAATPQQRTLIRLRRAPATAATPVAAQLAGIPHYIISMPNNDDHFSSSKNKLGFESRALYDHLKDKDIDCYYSNVSKENGKTIQNFINDQEDDFMPNWCNNRIAFYQEDSRTEQVQNLRTELEASMNTVRDNTDWIGHFLQDIGIYKALDELKELETKSVETFEKFKADDIARWTAELNETPSFDPADISVIDETLKNGNLSETEQDNLRDLEADLLVATAALKALPTEAVLRAEIAKLKKAVQSGEDEKKSIQQLIFAVTDYAAKRAELTFAPLTMNRAQISLMDVVKSTGEVKNVFRFTYDGKDYR